MTSGFYSGDFLRGLTFRVLFFLSLALLPIGLIAISQTQQIAEQNRISAELSLLAITEQAATAEAGLMQEAFGASEALASIVKLYRDDPEQCSRFFRAYIEANAVYALVGFIRTDGMMTCSSSDAPFDFSNDPSFKQSLLHPDITTRTLQSGAITNRPVTVITTPVYYEGELDGFIAISIPLSAFGTLREPTLPISPLALMVFNRHGEILITERGLDVVKDELPANVALAVFTEEEPTVFEADNQKLQPRVYAVRPVVRNEIFAVSVWSTDVPFLNPSIMTRLSALLPIVMWAASLVVAFWALNRLAIRHIRKLGRQMRRFALNRDLPRNTLGPGVPAEIVEIEGTFIGMGESILRDEAQLEDSLREKNILLKEVHHRVKNNLQMISSIMNMQIRQARTSEVKLVLERLQERVLSLATVHKNLYQTDDLVQVNAGTMLREVVGQLLTAGLMPGSRIRVEQEFADLMLNADDAAPLTLLVSECVTNALKHVGPTADGPGRIEIRLLEVGPARARLLISNTKSPEPVDPGTGLGFKLINAFARQLNGQFEVEETEDQYRLTLDFPVPQLPRPRTDF